MLSPDARVTTEILWKGAAVFAVVDAVYIAVLARLIEPERLRRMKWALVATMAVFFTLLWGVLASYYFWGSVYGYFFPEWIRWVLPPLYGVLFAAVGLLCWWIAARLPGNAVVRFCLLGGVWGMATHTWAVYRGIVEKPPLLRGASPVAAVGIAIFEFVFYWCVCLSIAALVERRWGRRVA